MRVLLLAARQSFESLKLVIAKARLKMSQQRRPATLAMPAIQALARKLPCNIDESSGSLRHLPAVVALGLLL
jgi:hypothetical protein